MYLRTTSIILMNTLRFHMMRSLKTHYQANN